MKLQSIGFIGGGRITRIFLQGLVNKNALPENVLVFEPNTETSTALINDFPGVQAARSAAEAATQQLVFIAVHPPVVMETLQAIKEAVDTSTVVISLAPKITLEKMAAVLPTQKLIRMIPNATSFINEGYNPVTFAPGFDDQDKKKVLKLLKKLGKTFEAEEAKLESYAICSAMLPTYFWFQWQQMEAIARETGLTDEEARKTVSASLKKAWRIYYQAGLEAEEVMDLIPVKPIGENEPEIKNILNSKLLGLFGKIKP
ncbi:NAD(P)-binding domain-containing protein [Maribellus sp. YY47]|uniref:pyrroline-5-carboxylate reductase family protein n=1 Tax=Maribellus sp. YY47 TaxID=2929486 RepID=UPI0020010FDA|nr:NAD(P)-binding domain-containing protein [Maribellus sp. YY47]MCK3684255.1 NAD(P)-binding domain-containing protein [Maribellus sp. YY47]